MLTVRDGKWTDLTVEIDLSEAFRYLGRRGEKTRISPEVLEISEEMRCLAIALSKPSGIGFSYQVSMTSTELVIGESLIISGPQTYKRLGPLSQAYLFAVTIGPGLEDQVNQFFDQGEYTKGAVLDSMGSIAVESVAEQVNQALRQTASRDGLVAKERISPGYGDWPLEAQFALFPLTGGEEIGITLNSTGLLTPRKTITALIGIGPVCSSRPETAGCSECLLADCQFRN